MEWNVNVHTYLQERGDFTDIVLHGGLKTRTQIPFHVVAMETVETNSSRVPPSCSLKEKKQRLAQDDVSVVQEGLKQSSLESSTRILSVSWQDRYRKLDFIKDLLYAKYCTGASTQASRPSPGRWNQPLGSEGIQWGDNGTEVLNCFAQGLWVIQRGLKHMLFELFYSISL